MTDFFTETFAERTLPDLLLELVAFVLGILSVWYARNQNILVYPTGLIATVITTWLLYKVGYYGDMLINAWFSIMSIYGWYKWSTPSSDSGELPITRTDNSQKIRGFLLFCLTIFVVFTIYTFLGQEISTDHYIDIAAAGIFFTAMWYMALKKIENWTLWIIGNIIVTPLYAYRGLWLLALQYLIFTLLAISAYLAWRKILNNNKQIS